MKKVVLLLLILLFIDMGSQSLSFTNSYLVLYPPDDAMVSDLLGKPGAQYFKYRVSEFRDDHSLYVETDYQVGSGSIVEITLDFQDTVINFADENNSIEDSVTITIDGFPLIYENYPQLFQQYVNMFFFPISYRWGSNPENFNPTIQETLDDMDFAELWASTQANRSMVLENFDEISSWSAEDIDGGLLKETALRYSTESGDHGIYGILNINYGVTFLYVHMTSESSIAFEMQPETDIYPQIVGSGDFSSNYNLADYVYPDGMPGISAPMTSEEYLLIFYVAIVLLVVGKWIRDSRRKRTGIRKIKNQQMEEYHLLQSRKEIKYDKVSTFQGFFSTNTLLSIFVFLSIGIIILRLTVFEGIYASVFGGLSTDIAGPMFIRMIIKLYFFLLFTFIILVYVRDDYVFAYQNSFIFKVMLPAIIVFFVLTGIFIWSWIRFMGI
ncbi:MAG: hypothetical protein INQ03_00705 [Candidatus Heimdallarchaeota archaeon]|nr:hypothetical protein [Candidatus Heimdallarchaeota archaeon]